MTQTVVEAAVSGSAITSVRVSPDIAYVPSPDTSPVCRQLPSVRTVNVPSSVIVRAGVVMSTS